MADYVDSLAAALRLVEQANEALAEAASILRNDPDAEIDELAFGAMKLEGETGVLILRLQRVNNRKEQSGKPAAAGTDS